MAICRPAAVIAAFCINSVLFGSQSVTVDVGFDRWMYPFNVTAGSRTSGSTFGALGNPSFDDRDAQVIIGFDTLVAGVPADYDPAQYEIRSISVTLSTSTPTEQSFHLDSTYDEYLTYVDPAFDTDIGRPVELYGVGARNGFTSPSLSDAMTGTPFFEEDEAFGFPGPPASEQRNVFPSDYNKGVSRDISNNVRNSFDPSPWAIGTVSGLNDGEQVPVDSQMIFSVDTENLYAMRYLQDGLSRGTLFFAITSMHSAALGSGNGIPAFHLKDTNGGSAGQTARLSLEYAIVPEPSGGPITLVALSFFLVRRARKK